MVKNRSGAAVGTVAVLAAGCFWGSVGLFVRILDALDYSPLTIVFSRMSLACALTGGAALLVGDRKKLRLRVRDLWCFIGAGIASAILLNVFYSISTIMNSLALAAVLLATTPVFVVLLSAPLFREKITAGKLQALGLAFAGCVLVSGAIGSGASFSAAGLAIGLAAGLGYALYSIFTRCALDRGYTPLTINIYSFLIGALACVPFTDFSLLAATVAAAPARMTLLLLAHTLCTSLFPYLLYTLGMKYMDTGRAAILVSVEPVAAALLGILVYGEIPSLTSGLGIILVLLAVARLQIKASNQDIKASNQESGK